MPTVLYRLFIHVERAKHKRENVVKFPVENK